MIIVFQKSFKTSFLGRRDRVRWGMSPYESLTSNRACFSFSLWQNTRVGIQEEAFVTRSMIIQRAT